MATLRRDTVVVARAWVASDDELCVFVIRRLGWAVLMSDRDLVVGPLRFGSSRRTTRTTESDDE